MSAVVKTYLTERQEQAPSGEVCQTWAELEDLYTRKSVAESPLGSQRSHAFCPSNRLWHQLTVRLKEFVKSDCFNGSKGLLEVRINDIY